MVTRATTESAAVQEQAPAPAPVPPSYASSESTFRPTAAEDIRALIFQRKELHDISDYRLRTLEKAVSDKESDLSLERSRFAKLKEDFQYNLKLIEDRDSELARYDQTFEAAERTARQGGRY